MDSLSVESFQRLSFAFCVGWHTYGYMNRQNLQGMPNLEKYVRNDDFD